MGFEESPEIAANSSKYPYILQQVVFWAYNSGTMTRRTPNKELVLRYSVHSPHDAEVKRN